MRITSGQLKKIIREEVIRLHSSRLLESDDDDTRARAAVEYAKSLGWNRSDLTLQTPLSKVIVDFLNHIIMLEDKGEIIESNKFQNYIASNLQTTVNPVAVLNKMVSLDSANALWLQGIISDAKGNAVKQVRRGNTLARNRRTRQGSPDSNM